MTIIIMVDYEMNPEVYRALLSNRTFCDEDNVLYLYFLIW